LKTKSDFHPSCIKQPESTKVELLCFKTMVWCVNALPNGWWPNE